jgi:hypothetical protein
MKIRQHAPGPFGVSVASNAVREVSFPAADAVKLTVGYY